MKLFCIREFVVDINQFQAAVKQHGSGRCEVIVIDGADHIFFTWVWKQQVITQTVAWLNGVLQPR